MQRNDLSRSLVAFDQNSTLVAVIELSLKSWVVAGVVPGLGRDTREEAECRLQRAFEAASSMARRGDQGGRRDQADGGGIRSWARRFLVGAVAAGSGDRGLRHPSHQHCSVARAAAGEIGSAGYANCSSGRFWVGCVGKPNTAAWWRSPRLRRRTRSGPTVSMRHLVGRTHEDGEPDEGDDGSPRHPWFQLKLRKALKTARGAAHAGRRATAGQHARRSSSRDMARLQLDARSDQ